MGNKTGSVRKLDQDSEEDDNQRKRSAAVRKNAQAGKGCETAPTNRRRSSGGNGDPNSTAPAAPMSKKKSTSLLSEHQKQVITRSWKQQINRHSGDNIGVRTFLNVFDLSPEIKRMFGFDDNWTRDKLLFDKRFQRQAKAFVRVIDDAVRDIEQLEDEVHGRLRSLGARHTKFRSSSTGSIKMQQWDAFAEAMLEGIIESQRGVHKHRDTAATWRIFITWIIGIMKQGYYDALKAERRATSVGLPPQVNETPRRQETHTLAPIGHACANLSTSPSPSPVPHSRNHSVCYGPYEDERTKQRPPPSPLPSAHFLEPSLIHCKSAPHSPYAIKQHPSTVPVGQHELLPKRSFVVDRAPGQHQLPRPRASEPCRMGNMAYQNFQYDETEDESACVDRLDENYPNQYYSSDYY